MGNLSKLHFEDSSIKARIEEWLSDYYDKESRDEIQTLIDNGNTEDLADRFYRDLKFGTGGLRGVMEAGTNRINKYVIMKATQGLANFLMMEDENAKEKGIAIACDSRNNSQKFAVETGLVFAANGFKVYIFDKLRPTPELSFAVRKLGTIAGIVITASHNPPEYNGYKVYGPDGGQIVPPWDKMIIDEVNKVKSLSEVKTIKLEDAKAKNLWLKISDEIDKDYLSRVTDLSVNSDIIIENGDKVKIVFSPIHGSGYKLVPEALEKLGFKDINVVESQGKPDGNFPTVKSPNPEEKDTLGKALELAENIGADLILGTDPDCDRVGIIVKHNNEYVIMNGNQLGSILTYYILSQLNEKNELPENGLIVKTIVTTDLMERIASAYNIPTESFLTGFKYIGERISYYEEMGTDNKNYKKYIFGGEESYGFLAGTFVRDKDAVIASILTVEAALYYKLQGKTLIDVLHEIFTELGCFQEHLETMKFAGKAGAEIIKKITTELRNNPPVEIGGFEVEKIKDYKDGLDDLPPADVIAFYFKDKGKVTIRPSGTEPKIKFYLSIYSNVGDKDIMSVIDSTKADMDTINNAFIKIVNDIANG